MSRCLVDCDQLIATLEMQGSTSPRKSPRKRVRLSSGESPLTGKRTSEPEDSFGSARTDRLSVRRARSVSIGVCRSLEFVALSSASQGMMQQCADGKVATGPPPLASAAEAKLPRIGHNSTRVEMSEPSFLQPSHRGGSVSSKRSVESRLSTSSTLLGSLASSSFASLGSFTMLLAGGKNSALDTPPGAPDAFQKSAELMRAPLRTSSVARPSQLGARSVPAALVTRLW